MSAEDDSTLLPSSEEGVDFSKNSSNSDTDPMTSSSSSGGSSEETPFEPDEEWQDCSLCEAADCDDHGLVPLPGRESHTADLDQFLKYVQEVQAVQRHPLEPQFNEDFWVFCKGVLENGIPIGYGGVEDPKAVVEKSAADSGALIQKYMATTPMNPIYPAQVSLMSGIPINSVLTELLYATKVGMMSMRWTPLCDRCGTPTCAKIERMTETILPTTSWCRSCRFENPIDALAKINVVFILHNDVFYALAESMACKPSDLSLSLSLFFTMVPATFSGSGFRFSVGCDGDRALRPPMPKGIYRMHCPIALTDNWFVVERDAIPEDEPCLCEVHVSDYVYRGGKRKVITAPHGKVRFDVFCDTQSYFILWIQFNLDEKQLLYVPPEERPLKTSAAEVMQHFTYRLLFEGSDTEKDNFEGAVAKMTLGDPSVAPSV